MAAGVFFNPCGTTHQRAGEFLIFCTVKLQQVLQCTERGRAIFGPNVKHWNQDPAVNFIARASRDLHGFPRLFLFHFCFIFATFNPPVGGF